jgi:hypothetical protein
MKRFAPQWIDEWCHANGWTDWFIDRTGYWAFPPRAVMPLPIPHQALRAIKSEKGLSREEKFWCATAVASAAVTGWLSYALTSPMPLVAAFAFCAIVVVSLDDDTFY